MNKTAVIAISGKAQSGKDTFANMVAYCIGLFKVNKAPDNWFNLDHYYYFYHRYSLAGAVKVRFADPLKESIAPLLHCSREDLEEISYKSSTINWLDPPITIRGFMQNFGDCVKEKFGKDFWAKLLINTIKPYLNEENIIIPDLRYQNELEVLKKECNNLITVRIIRNTENLDHSSEKDLDSYTKWDYIVDNLGTKEELLIKAKSFCERFKLI